LSFTKLVGAGQYAKAPPPVLAPPLLDVAPDDPVTETATVAPDELDIEAAIEAVGLPVEPPTGPETLAPLDELATVALLEALLLARFVDPPLLPLVLVVVVGEPELAPLPEPPAIDPDEPSPVVPLAPSEVKAVVVLALEEPFALEPEQAARLRPRQVSSRRRVMIPRGQ
jgi:hypothetical protein